MKDWHGREMITCSQLRKWWNRMASKGCRVMWTREKILLKVRKKLFYCKDG